MGELSRQMPPDIMPAVKDALIPHASEGKDAIEGALRALLAEVLPDEFGARR